MYEIENSVGILLCFQDAECGLHKFFVSFNLILCVGISVVSILPKIQEGW